MKLQVTAPQSGAVRVCRGPLHPPPRRHTHTHISVLLLVATCHVSRVTSTSCGSSAWPEEEASWSRTIELMAGVPHGVPGTYAHTTTTEEHVETSVSHRLVPHLLPKPIYVEWHQELTGQARP